MRSFQKQKKTEKSSKSFNTGNSELPITSLGPALAGTIFLLATECASTKTLEPSLSEEEVIVNTVRWEVPVQAQQAAAAVGTVGEISAWLCVPEVSGKGRETELCMKTGKWDSVPLVSSLGPGVLYVISYILPLNK